jgi:hypothetical protein
MDSDLQKYFIAALLPSRVVNFPLPTYPKWENGKSVGKWDGKWENGKTEWKKRANPSKCKIEVH